ncbi:hypothetical protein GOQ29_14005 [Clostridium sp. D2Q-14]|uniref:hypothetical protein n=1 Tax=Anaeromonas gelatinilytica TaxID=2683194 RepID=UPI00193C7A12|nr:hypothetical protein [Anaeromonas gelatinilytica]MBS4536733.1 hypothetical protein [Anaeromonas gelatinilytica]
MLKFMKYEIKGSMRFVGIVFITMILLSTVLLIRADIDNVPSTITLSMISIIGGSIAILILFINSFSKEVYEDRAYLTLTLPISGVSIVLSKLLVTILWYVLYGIVQIGFVALMLNKYSGLVEEPIFSNFINYMQEIMKTPEMIIFLILGVIQSVIFILTVYFSIAISKAALGTKKVGKFISFIIFILLNTAISAITVLIENKIPFGIKINMEGLNEIGITMNEFNVPGLEMNVPSLIFSITLIIVFLFTTGYILERKIDL